MSEKTERNIQKNENLLEIRHLSVAFRMYEKGLVQKNLEVIHDLNVTVHRGEILAIVGASGSGKSVLASAILGVLPQNAQVGGEVLFENEVLTPERLKRLRGKEIGYIPQSVDYLDPLMKAGKQVRGVDGSTERQREIFRNLRLDESTEEKYPFALSGGMTRRVLIATAQMTDAALIIADEPTPGLGKEIAAMVLKHLRALADEGRGVILITHDIDLAVEFADRVSVFYAGTTMENAVATDFADAGAKLRHPYTRALWRALPSGEFSAISGTQPYAGNLPKGCLFAPRCAYCDESCKREEGSCPRGQGLALYEYDGGETACIRCRELREIWQREAKEERVASGSGTVQEADRLVMRQVRFSYDRKKMILDGINLELQAGERVALVGPSGCGKSTLSKVLAGYLQPQEGSVLCNDAPLPHRGHCPVQLIFQHPELAVNPRLKLGKTLTEGWTPDPEVMEEMGIEEAWLARYPVELSGGELQRFCIARAIGPQTRFVIADEMTTMLDAVTQAQIWHMMLRLVERRRIGLLVVTHNEPLAQRICTRIIRFPSVQERPSS